MQLVFKETNVMSQHLDSNYVITDNWTRPSSTTLLLGYDSTTGTLQPFEHLYIDSISSSYAAVSGYYYELFAAPDSVDPIGYWGIDSGIIGNADSIRFDYTLLLTNPSATCNPVDTTVTTNIKELTNGIQVSFYPNPVEDAGLLEVFTEANIKATISLSDQQGRTIQSIYNGDLSNGRSSFNIDTKALSSGMYFIVVNSDSEKRTLKFLKYE
jgi:hypothetical protein